MSPSWSFVMQFIVFDGNPFSVVYLEMIMFCCALQVSGMTIHNNSVYNNCFIMYIYLKDGVMSVIITAFDHLYSLTNLWSKLLFLF